MGYLAHVVEYASRGSRFVICAVYFNLIDSSEPLNEAVAPSTMYTFSSAVFRSMGESALEETFSPFRSNDSVPVVVFPYFDGILAELKSDAEWLE